MSEPDDPWYPFDGGRTLGGGGSESGIMLCDDEHEFGARISLERDAKTAPFAITCGIYDWMVHTRFFRHEEDARRDFAAMKQALDAILRSIPFKTDPDLDAKMRATTQQIEQFIERFP